MAPASPNPNAVLKTGLAVATCVVLLVAYRRFVDPAKGISPSLFRSAAKVTLFRHPPAAAVPASPVKCVQVAVAPGVRPAISPYFVDDSGSMDAFFSQLRTLEEPAGPGPVQVVTVLHYGDSPTTADLITGDVRALLQQRFGDAGHGFVLTAKPWAWYQHRGVEISDEGWTVSTAVGKGREETYGIGGASFEGDADASSRIAMKDGSQTSMDVAYFGRPGGGTVAVSANGKALESFSTAAEALEPAWHPVALPAATKTVDLKPSSGRARLFGESFRTGARGVLYDSLGLNGASTTVLSNGFNPAAWAAELQHERPALVIINYGTNESGFGSYVDKYYEPSLRTAIKRVRTALPGVPVLVMSPMDRGERMGVDEIRTYDTIPRIVAIQKRVAAEQKCAFFDTFEAMGGDGTMARWYTGQPRLVAGDLIHPTPRGASMVAQLLVTDLLKGYDAYLKRQPSHPLPAPPTTLPAQGSLPKAH